MLIGFALEEAGDARPSEAEQLREFGCHRVFVSARNTVMADDVFDYLRQDDTLVVTELPRLASSIRELILIGQRLHEAGVSLHVIRNNLRPEAPVGAAFGPVCSIFAEFCQEIEKTEHERIRSTHRGRPAALSPEDQKRAKRLLQRSSVLEVARLLKVSPATIYRYFPRRRPSEAAAWRDNRLRFVNHQERSPPKKT